MKSYWLMKRDFKWRGSVAALTLEAPLDKKFRGGRRTRWLREIPGGTVAHLSMKGIIPAYACFDLISEKQQTSFLWLTWVEAGIVTVLVMCDKAGCLVLMESLTRRLLTWYSSKWTKAAFLTSDTYLVAHILHSWVQIRPDILILPPIPSSG